MPVVFFGLFSFWIWNDSLIPEIISFTPVYYSAGSVACIVPRFFIFYLHLLVIFEDVMHEFVM